MSLSTTLSSSLIITLFQVYYCTYPLIGSHNLTLPLIFTLTLLLTIALYLTLTPCVVFSNSITQSPYFQENNLPWDSFVRFIDAQKLEKNAPIGSPKVGDPPGSSVYTFTQRKKTDH